jgi:hypothetical protein
MLYYGYLWSIKCKTSNMVWYFCDHSNTLLYDPFKLIPFFYYYTKLMYLFNERKHQQAHERTHLALATQFQEEMVVVQVGMNKLMAVLGAWPASAQ